MDKSHSFGLLRFATLAIYLSALQPSVASRELLSPIIVPAVNTQIGVVSEDERIRAILADIPRLQERARPANGGALGCGRGLYEIVNSEGEALSITGGLDPIHVFGSRIETFDLFVILRSRIESNLVDGEGPMSGDVSDLCYVSLSILSRANDPDSVPIIADLLDDSDDSINAWAVIALLRLADTNEDLKADIALIAFPSDAIRRARSRSHEIPDWVIERDQ